MGFVRGSFRSILSHSDSFNPRFLPSWHRSCLRGAMFDIKTIAIIAVALSQVAWQAGAATWNSDGTRSSVQSIHDTVAANGDTITIPSGTFEWTTGVTITKAVTLSGLGTITTDVKGRATACGTKITCSVSGVVIDVDLVANLNTRITGIELLRGSTYSGVGAIKVEGVNTGNRRIRIDHCVFNQLQTWAVNIDSAIGVVGRWTQVCGTARRASPPVAAHRGQMTRTTAPTSSFTLRITQWLGNTADPRPA
jgi:hypothetical protein